MANFGIQSAGVVLTATDNADTVQLLNPATAVVTASTTLGLGGNDLLYIGALGQTSYSTFDYSGGPSGGSGTITLTLVGSASISTSVNVASGAAAISTGGTVSGVVTSTRGTRTLAASQLYGNAGNDTIALGNQLSNLSASTIGGGAGDDVIGTYTYVNSTLALNKDLDVSAAGGIGTAGSANASFIEAGGGNDSITLAFSSTKLSANTIGGSQGDDTIELNLGGTVETRANFIAGGGGADLVSANLGGTGNTLYGGGGNDSISLTAEAAFHGNTIGGDTYAAASDWDGDDLITAEFAGAYSSNTVAGGGGADTIIVTAGVDGGDGGNNYWYLNGGADSIAFKTVISGSTVGAGAGADSVFIASGVGAATVIQLGGDDDHLNFSAASNIDSGDHVGTVYGGAGADRIMSGGTLSGGGTVQMVFGYSATTDSTLAGYDTIAVGGANTSGTFKFNYVPGGVSLASFNGVGLSGTQGVVSFTSTYGDSDVTARASAIATNTSASEAVIFRDGNNVNYLFIKGSSLSESAIVQVGSAAGTGVNGTITLDGGKNITMGIA